MVEKAWHIDQHLYLDVYAKRLQNYQLKYRNVHYLLVHHYHLLL